MTDASSNETTRADIGLVCALPIECGAFLDRFDRVNSYSGGEFAFRGGRYAGIRVAVAFSGVGFARARRATLALLEGHSPRWLLSAGFSGALLPEMEVGHITLADALCDTHGNELPVDCTIPDDHEHGLHVGRHVCADALVRTVAEKESLAAAHDAIAVDLESLAVAQVARERSVPFLSIRVISDDMSADLPAEIATLMTTSGGRRLGAVFGAILNRPGSVKDMWNLRESALRSAERLATFLDGVVKQLHAAT